MPEQSEIDKHIASIQIRSEEIQDILGQIPNWLIRWGITVFFTVIFVLLVMSFFFKYPDIITSEITITTVNPPAAIVAYSTGKIDTLFVSDKQMIEQNQNLAIIHNTANFKDITQVTEIVNNFAKQTLFSDSSSVQSFKSNYSLGDIQPTYSQFVQKWNAYQNFQKLNYHAKKIASIQQQVAKTKELFASLTNQVVILEQDMKLIVNQYNRDSVLEKKGAIPMAEFERSKSIFFQKKYSLMNADNTLSNTKIQISQLEQNILDLQLDFLQQDNKQQTDIRTAIDELLSQLKKWEQMYLLKSPIDGQITFAKIWKSNQNVKNGETVFNIVPTHKIQIIGRIQLPIQGSGKVKTGQNVNIKLQSFPYMEYGMIRSRIKNISLMPTENLYIAEVDLPDSLITNYNKKIPFSQEMKGTAEIITEDLRLIERFIYPLKSLLRNN